MFIQKNQTMKNDWYFNLYTSNESISETEKKIIEIIDHAKVTPEKRIETKYGLGTLRNLSSGCKTLLNVMKNPDKIVNIEECGKNVLDLLFSLNNIHVYLSRPERIHIDENAKICFNNTYIVTGLQCFEQWWTDEYSRSNSNDI